jgi:hypothetical protein
MAMKASEGDQLLMHSRTVEETDRKGTILEVRGADGSPPFLVRFDDGHERLVFPAGNCEVVQRRFQGA